MLPHRAQAQPHLQLPSRALSRHRNRALSLVANLRLNPARSQAVNRALAHRRCHLKVPVRSPPLNLARGPHRSRARFLVVNPVASHRLM